MSRIFIDMDGVIVDFDKFRDDHGLTGDQVKCMPGAYLAMPPIPGAIDAVRVLINMGYEVWLATKPPTGVAHAYSDKAAWVLQHLPELKRNIIITHDKGLLGGPDDYLCDDRPHKANCELFQGTLLRFVDGYHWPQALEFFNQQRQMPASVGQNGTTKQVFLVNLDEGYNRSETQRVCSTKEQAQSYIDSFSVSDRHMFVIAQCDMDC